VRTVIAEDSALFREGLARLLEDADHEVVAKVADADALVAAVHRTRPDLVVADIHMPPHHGDDGARAAHSIRQNHPDLGIVLLSAHLETQCAVELVSSGGFGYLLKDRVFDIDEFLDALRRVAAGGTALDPEVVAQLLLRRGADPLAALTQRERDVLALMAEGRSNPEIAATLVITESAVSKHINSIFAKLGLHQGDTGHRRVLAVLRYLGAAPAT
jgi:DNA-binding NarL/FixJ family response regulator